MSEKGSKSSTNLVINKQPRPHRAAAVRSQARWHYTTHLHPKASSQALLPRRRTPRSPTLNDTLITMPLQGIVYILTNKNNTTLYTGVTRNLRRRVAEHKLHINKGFSDRYNTEKLVYYEVYDLLVDGIHREKQLKKWHREWKEKLISEFNPTWEDLSDSIGLNEEYIQSVKEEYENGYYDNETP